MSTQKTIILLLFGLGLAGLVMIVVSFLNQLACEGQLLNHQFDPTFDQQIWGERVISQSFVAPRNGLERIRVMFLTRNRRNTRAVTMRLLEISEDLDNPLLGTELSRTTFNAGAVHDQEWVSFSFPPIPDSAGKSYLISLESPESEPGDALSIGGIQKDVYKPGLAYFGFTPLRADITFLTCYDLTWPEKFQVLFEQLTRHRPALLGNINFYLFCFGSYVLVLAVFFWKLVKLTGA